MQSFLAIQNTYDIFQIALFTNKKLRDVRQKDKRYTSKLFIPLLDELLTTNTITLNDLAFIAVNQGPGPFSTLRSIIASVNGLYFATKIPLIGIDGLDATLSAFHDPQHTTIVLLNAFNFDVYYAIEQKEKKSIKGYKKIDTFLHNLKQEFPSKHFRFIGNAVPIYQERIANVLGKNAFIPKNIPHMCTVEHIGILGLKAWEKQEITPDYLFPLHLKKHAVEK